MAVELPPIPNLRDVGGVAATGGTLAPGRLYRSVDLSRIGETEAGLLAGLGITHVFDLRTTAERVSAPDVLPDGSADRHLDVFRDYTRAAAANLREILIRPELTAEFVTGGRARQFMLDSYRAMVTLPSGHEAYGSLIREISTSEVALVHCTTGKDRTGWAVAATLLLLGVDEADVYTDYLRTNDDLLPALAPVFDAFEDNGGSREDLLPLLSVDRDYLDAAREIVDSEFGGIHRYAHLALGLTDDDLTALAEALVEGGRH